MHSVWILEWYWLPFHLFLCLLSETTPTTLWSRHRSRLSSRMPPSLCRWITDQRRIDVSRTRCLMTTMRLSLHCIYLAGAIRRSVCDTIVPRATVTNMAYGKPRGVTVSVTNLLRYFDIYYRYKYHHIFCVQIFRKRFSLIEATGKKDCRNFRRLIVQTTVLKVTLRIEWNHRNVRSNYKPVNRMFSSRTNQPSEMSDACTRLSRQLEIYDCQWM